MGVVYRAHDRVGDRTVALKLLHPQLREDRERRARFVREADAISRLQHPCIAALYEHGEVHMPEGSTLYIAMEFAPGRDISARMLHEEFDEAAIVSVGHQIATALVVAHGQGVVHRDLKPANVVLDRDGRVKILDFGLAKLINEPVERENPEAFETQIGMVVGTAPYSAPEQLRGARTDPRVDLFSLGVILFQMATGRVPFPGASTAEMLERVQREPAPTLQTLAPHFGEATAAIVDRLLATDPEDRFPSAVELVAAFEAVAAAMPETPVDGAGEGAGDEIGGEEAGRGGLRSRLSSFLRSRRGS
jgi:serine/threonine-protein kinase